MAFCPSVGYQYKSKDTNLLRLAKKALYIPFWPEFMRLDVQKPPSNLRSTGGAQVQIPAMTNIFQDHAVTLLNKLFLRHFLNTANHGVFSRG